MKLSHDQEIRNLKDKIKKLQSEVEELSSRLELVYEKLSDRLDRQSATIKEIDHRTYSLGKW